MTEGGRGLFIVLDGVEGGGKSTQARLLASWLAGRGIPHRLAREPGGTPVGEAIRGILLDQGDLPVPPETELLLLLAARAAFVRGVVIPALERGEVMIADRFELSTFAYQGVGRGLGLEPIRPLNAFATSGVRPDLTVVLDLPVAEGRARQSREGRPRDRIEGEEDSFLERVRGAYLDLAREDSRVVVLDSSESQEEVHRALQRVLIDRFPEPFSSTRG